MKKVFLIISVILSLSISKANAQTDTLAVLQNIVTNKATYIGQPFSVLLAQIPLGIKHFEPPVGPPNNKNAEPSTLFAFYYPQTANQFSRTFPKLLISWEPALNRITSETLFSQHRGAWSSTIAAHYNSAIIADIFVITGLQ